MTSAARLKKRVDYFLTSRVGGRREVSDFSKAALQFGQVYIVGGMLRDLFLDGNRKFCSDVDFIIDGCSKEEFRRFMAGNDAASNRFGGYRVQLNHWSVEMWRLQDTWAHREGLCSITSVKDVAKATFFDWDAVFYDLHARRLIVEPDYFSRLRARILEVRLPHNPNVAGNVVRALRYAIKWNAVLGPRLARIVLRELNDQDWKWFLDYEAASFRSLLLPSLDGAEVVRQLRRYDQNGCANNLVIRPRIYQPALPFTAERHEAQLQLAV